VKTVTRETDFTIIDKLKDNFVEDGSYTKDKIAVEFRRLMEETPDDICVLVGYDDDVIVGFLIGLVDGIWNYSFIEQAWSIADSDFSKHGMEVFAVWSKLKGMEKIKLITSRNSVQMRCSKMYGFTESSVIMERLI
jgi:hypothetical protein